MRENDANAKNPYQPFVWLIGAVVSLLAIVVWGNSFSWRFSGLSAYQIFPLLGLLAFSLMWSQYALSAIKKNWASKLDLKEYYRWTGWLVLIAIVLHPGILIYQRARDGFGWPPGSYENYVAPSLAWVTLLGTACLLVFLAYELGRWLKNYKWWRYMNYLVDLAMLGIFYHSLSLGTQTHISWYRIIWWLYGLSLIVILLQKYFVLAKDRNLIRAR